MNIERLKQTEILFSRAVNREKKARHNFNLLKNCVNEYDADEMYEFYSGALESVNFLAQELISETLRFMSINDRDVGYARQIRKEYEQYISESNDYKIRKLATQVADYVERITG